MDIKGLIKTNHSISKIDQQSQKIKLTFKNDKTFECDYLIISDGVFLKAKDLFQITKINQDIITPWLIDGNNHFFKD